MPNVDIPTHIELLLNPTTLMSRCKQMLYIPS